MVDIEVKASGEGHPTGKTWLWTRSDRGHGPVYRRVGGVPHRVDQGGGGSQGSNLGGGGPQGPDLGGGQRLES